MMIPQNPPSVNRQSIENAIKKHIFGIEIRPIIWYNVNKDIICSHKAPMRGIAKGLPESSPQQIVMKGMGSL